MASPVPYGRLMGRAWRLRCVLCGEGRPFNGWFGTEHHCPRCGYVFMREPGYFLGSIYMNYGLTAVLTLGAFFVIELGFDGGSTSVYGALIAVAVLFPCWFYRYSRGLWMALDVFCDPPKPSEFIATDASRT